MEGANPWQHLIVAVLTLPVHARLRVDADEVPHPTQAGFYRSSGLAKALAHYRHPLPDGRGLHVHVHEDHYVVHWDQVDPSVSVLRHFTQDVLLVLRRTLRGEWRREVQRVSIAAA